MEKRTSNFLAAGLLFSIRDYCFSLYSKVDFLAKLTCKTTTKITSDWTCTCKKEQVYFRIDLFFFKRIQFFRIDLFYYIIMPIVGDDICTRK